MTKIEGMLKSSFGEEMRLRLPGFVLLQYSTAGAPDRSVIGAGRQTNWEFKHATPDFDSPDGQALKCTQLAGAGHCRYVLWHEVGDTKKTLIVHPRHVLGRDEWTNIPNEAFCIGHDMRWLVEYIRKEHGLKPY